MMMMRHELKYWNHDLNTDTSLNLSTIGTWQVHITKEMSDKIWKKKIEVNIYLYIYKC
jgi:hypothetical protein